jgi:hypothetical protein
VSRDETRPSVPRRPGRTRRLVAWGVLALILLIPIPTQDGIWLPLLFRFFDWLNNFLPENF